MSCNSLYILLIVGVIGGKVETSSNALSQCQMIAVQASTNQINVSGLPTDFALQNITGINGTAVTASDGSYNNTSLMTFTSGTPYTIHYGNDSISCYYNVTTKPMPVTSLWTAASSSSSLSLSWTKPAEFQASYHYVVKTFVTSPSTLINTSMTANENITIVNLPAGETFTFLVYTRAANNATDSDPVSLSTCTVPRKALNVTASNYKSANSLVANWTAPAGKVSSYNVTVTGDVNQTKSTNSTQLTFTGLSPGREYNVTVETFSGNCSQASLPVTEATYPTPPGNMSIGATGTNTTVLSWGEPGNMTNVTKSYVITYWNISSSLNWTQTSNTSNVTLRNLTSGANYIISVVTAGVRHYLSVPVSRWVYTKPFPVKNLQSLMTSNTMFLQWTKPDEYKNVYKYKVWANMTSPSSSNTTVAVESTMLKSLSPGETYTVLVYTIVGDGVAESDPVSVTNCTVPGQAVNVTADSYKSVNSLAVNWTAPAGKASYYNVTITGDVNRMIKTNITQANFTGLSPGRNYIVTVQTFSGSCSSAITNVTEATYPSPPGNITFNAINANIIALSWGDPANMTDAIKSYNLTYGNSSSNNWTITRSIPFAILQSLTAGTNYTFSVVTVGLRQHRSVPVTRWVYTKPLPVKWLKVSNVMSSAVLLTWTRPDGNITFYSYRVQTSVTSPSTLINNMIVTNESATIVSLTPGETYTFLVYTRAADNVTESDPVSLTTCTVPGQTIPSVNNSKSNDSLVVTWNAPAGRATSYTVILTGATNKTLQTRVTQATFQGLAAGREYAITVQTLSGSCSQISQPITEATYPNPPTSLTFNKIETNSVTLSWGQPENMINATKSYQISWSSTWTVTSSTSVTLQSLASSTNYTVTVVTVGARGYRSDGVSRSVYTSPVEKPGSVQVVRSSSGETMNISFQGFDTFNGPIVAYAIILSTDLTASKPPEGVLVKTYNNFTAGLTKTYVTSLIENVSAARSNEISAQVGDGTQTHGYVNGPLNPKSQYRISVAGFTNINYDAATGVISEERSTATITGFTGSANATSASPPANHLAATLLLSLCPFLIRL